MADIIIVNKADGPLLENARITQKAYREGIHYYPKADGEWQTKVHMVSAIEGQGMETLQDDIDSFFVHMQSSFALSDKRKSQSEYWFEKETARILMDNFLENSEASKNYRSIKESLESGAMNHIQAILKLKADIK